jgi:Ca2+/Na+ antiporter
MGLSIHSIATGVLLGVVLMNIVLLMKIKDLVKYKRNMSLMLMPLSSMVLGAVIFTGIVMMAAKHLEFSVANIVMILLSFALIYLEIKRVKLLKYINVKKERALEAYKSFALRILYIEFVLIGLISLWMWLI